MSKILKRPEYIEYDMFDYDRTGTLKEDIDKLESEPILAQWDVPRAFFWSSCAWVLHTIILFIPVSLTILVYLAEGFTYMPIGMTVLFTFVFSTLYYLSRTRFFHIGYKISKSGILVDNLKVYPRFRYGNQDPTKFLQKLRIIAVILIILAIMINPFYLVGAGSALFLSFMKPQIDDGEKALYIPTYWYHGNKMNFDKVNSVPRRLLIYLILEDGVDTCPIFCTKENYEKVLKLIKHYLPDAEYVENEPVFK